MGIIDTLKRNIPLTGEPKSDIVPSDFEDPDPSNGSGEEENQSENQSGSQNGQEKGDSSGSQENTNETSEEVEDMIEDMEEIDAERDMSEWYDTKEDYEDPSGFIDSHFDQLQEERTAPEAEIEKRKQNRDNRIEDVRTGVSHQRVKEEYDDRFADEVKEAFRQIKTRSAPQPSEYGQRTNMRGVIRRKSGDKTEERLYMEMEPSEVGDRAITVVLDSSGSMDELEIKLALYALRDATRQIGDNFAAITYDTEKTGYGRSTYNVRTNLINGPHERFKPEHLDTFKAHGYTPTASGVDDGRSISELSPNSEDVLIVVTDGIANIDQDGNKHDEHSDNKAMNEANDAVAKAIAEGKRVIGVGVGEHLEDKSMRNIFGENYIRTDMTDIADTLVDIYEDQMNTT